METLDEAAPRVKVPILVPDHDLAREGSLSGIWLCGGGLRVVFASGLHVLMGENEVSDPAAAWASDAAREGYYSVGTVRGHVAQLTDPDSWSPRAAGGVEWGENGWSYIIAGKGNASLAELLDVAETMTTYQPRPSA